MANNQRGQMIPRGDGVWLLKVFIGSTVVNGKRKRKYSSRTFHGTTSQARTELTKIVRELDTDSFVTPSKLTVQQYLETWLKGKADVETKTKLDYEHRMKLDVYPIIGGLRLTQLGPGHVRQLYVALTETRELSPRTVRYTHTILNQALEMAVEDGMLQKNPCARKSVRQAIPKKVKTAPVILTPKEVNAVLDSSTGDVQKHTLWRLLLTAGLRPQEALALQWADLSGVFLSINRAQHEVGKGKKEITNTLKSNNSRRVIALSQETLDALQRHKAAQARAILEAGPHYCRMDFIFASRTGSALDIANVRRWWTAACVQADVSVRTLYTTRHTHASHSLASGGRVKDVAERLGNDPATLMSVYAHTLPGASAAVAEGAEGLLRMAR